MSKRTEVLFNNIWRCRIIWYDKTVNAFVFNPINIINVDFIYIEEDGKYSFAGECILFPSKDQRDWSKFTAPWYKKERFNPKTLKPFDRVLSKYDGGCWSANLFSHIEEENNKYHGTCSFVCNGSLVKKCIPYNDETKNLVGTTDEAPDFYRYWED